MGTVTWDAEAVPFGWLATGDELALPVLGGHWLLGGLTGSGKSVGLNSLLAGLAPLPYVQLVLIDPKRVGLAPWAPRAAVFAETHRQAAAALRVAGEAMDARWVAMRTADVDQHAPTVEAPLVVVVIDELQDLVSSGDRELDTECTLRLGHLIAQGRAAAVAVVVATQHPSHDLIPTSLRSRIPYKVAFATERVEGTVAILGELGRDVAPAHTIPQSRRGQCWVTREDSRIPRLARAYNVPSSSARRIAAATAHHRRPLTSTPDVEGEADPVGLLTAAPARRPAGSRPKRSKPAGQP